MLFAVVSPVYTKAQHHEHKMVRQGTDTTGLLRLARSIKAVNTDLFEAGAYKGKNGHVIQYRLLRPQGDKSKKYPLVVVLHGSGAVGNDNRKHMGVMANMWATPEVRQKYPAYVLAPQFLSRSSNYAMNKQRGVLASAGQACMQPLLNLLDSLKRLPGIDDRRIYLVGYSMGGSTTMNILSQWPELFAAAVPISCIPQFDNMETLRHIPIWLIHGNADDVNNIASDRQFYKEMGDKSLTTMWEFDKAGHEDIFTTSVIGEYLPQWLFQWEKPLPASPKGR
ncbi:prolyl oligopeptidase family serine peptidase [Nemorincola caseinilytica]